MHRPEMQRFAAGQLFPSDRWNKLHQMLGEAADGAQQGVNAAEATIDEAEDMCEAARKACKENKPHADIEKMLLSLTDRFLTCSQEAADGGYNVGFGDGWHAGIMTAFRALAPAMGMPAPEPSKALGFLLGITNQPVEVAKK